MTRQLNPGGPVPAEFRALAERAVASGTAVDLAAAGMVLQPPTPGKPRWRVRYTLDGARAEVGGGRTVETLYAAVTLVSNRLNAGRARVQPITVAAAIDRYIDEHKRMPGPGRKEPWRSRTVADRTRDFAKLKKEFGTVPMIDLTVEQLSSFVGRAGTLDRGTRLCKRVHHFLDWAFRAKLATAALRTEARDHLQWKAPAGYHHTDVRPSVLRESGQHANAARSSLDSRPRFDGGIAPPDYRRLELPSAPGTDPEVR